MVAVSEVLLLDAIDVPPYALCDILACHFKVHAAGMGSHLIMNIEEGPELVPDSIEVASLESAVGLPGVAVDGVGDPKNRLPFALDGADEARKILSHLLGSHSYNNSKATGDVVGIHGVDNADELVRSALVRNLDTDGISNAADELEMG